MENTVKALIEDAAKARTLLQEALMPTCLSPTGNVREAIDTLQGALNRFARLPQCRCPKIGGHCGHK